MGPQTTSPCLTCKHYKRNEAFKYTSVWNPGHEFDESSGAWCLKPIVPRFLSDGNAEAGLPEILTCTGHETKDK